MLCSGAVCSVLSEAELASLKLAQIYMHDSAVPPLALLRLLDWVIWDLGAGSCSGVSQLWIASTSF